MSGFGITIAMITMIIVANLTTSVYTEPLVMPDKFQHTATKRESWYIDMFDTSYTSISIPLLAISAVIPAFLVSVLIIMESHLTGVLVRKPGHRLVKGCTPNWDTFLMGAILLVCSLLGLPWLCADSVRTIEHIKTLTVYSKYSAPGEKPRVLYIHEQRVTIVLVHVLVGLFILFPSVIQSIPVAVLLGVFLFLGFLSLSGLQFVKRFKMLFMSAKYFPDYSFTSKVRTAKIHTFTVLQLILSALMFGIKLSPGSFLFPICVIGLALIRRYAMKSIFSEEEIEELDPEESGSELDESDHE
ncbi:anion exchange protein 3-like [Bolinopsis microptera]|uniref:anion exchange protein 3-like n=1 Tax=Bolinopsis microptera TaxID=2820187 RepID=UPI003079B799